MIPPSGFKAELYPLRHKFYYSMGLSSVTGVTNCSMMTLVKNYKGANPPIDIKVNPHNANFVKETGAICGKMSIIDKLSLSMRFTFTEYAVNDLTPLHITWMPIFFSFPEKLDASDEKTSITVEQILELVKDAVQQDVTPLYANTKMSTEGTSERLVPVSTQNFAEVFGTLNMDVNLTNEGIAWDNTLFHDALRYYTNKGALKACIGRSRHMTLDSNHKHQNYFIKKFVPRAVRRIVPYSFFAIMVRVAKPDEDDSGYCATIPTASKSQVGVQMMVNYNEWNVDHNQDSEDT